MHKEEIGTKEIVREGKSEKNIDRSKEKIVCTSN
jgi:hypothetical protein